MALRLNLIADRSGLAEIEQALASLRTRLSDIKPLLNEVSRIYYESTMTRFRSHTSPDGRSWKPLSPRTIADKKRLPSIESPYHQLIRTGKLRSAIKVRHIDGGVRIGLMKSEVPYAIHHQYGAPRANIPQRKFLGVTKVANEQVLKAMRKFVEER